MRLLFFLLFLSVCIAVPVSCKGPGTEAKQIDFEPSGGIESSDVQSADKIRVSIATVISPRESFVHYRRLFDYMAETLGVSIEYRQRNSYAEINRLISTNAVDLAFVCSAAYAMASDSMNLLVVPLHKGLPYYQAYLIAHKNSGIDRFENFRDKSFAVSDSLCFTGRLFIDFRLKNLGTNAKDFFRSEIQCYSHDVSILMVNRGLIDGASVNGLILDYMLRFHPNLVANIKIVEKSPNFGIPPLVTSNGLDENLRAKLEAFFLNIHQTENGRNILYNLNIDRFARGSDTLYVGIRNLVQP